MVTVDKWDTANNEWVPVGGGERWFMRPARPGWDVMLSSIDTMYYIVPEHVRKPQRYEWVGPYQTFEGACNAAEMMTDMGV